MNLDDVRELLKLDRRYFSGDDQSAVREVVSRLMVAGKQLLRRPTLLFDAIKKAQLSALWIPDKKRILIDETKPKLKHRWSEAHEIGHSIIPWHEHLLLGDNEFSLHPECHSQLEAEAIKSQCLRNNVLGQYAPGRIAHQIRYRPTPEVDKFAVDFLIIKLECLLTRFAIDQ